MLGHAGADCLFQREWWLDAVAPGRWDAVTVEGDDGQLDGWMPYTIRMDRLGLRAMMTPPCTPWLGPWTRPSPSPQPRRRLAHDMAILDRLAEQLPASDLFEQGFHHQVKTGLPFAQRGFDLGTRYTYIIADLSDLDAVWQSVSSSRRRRIKAAQKQLEVRETDDLDLFLHLYRQTFVRQGEEPTNTDDQVRRIDEACSRQDARRILIAFDESGTAHSGEYLVYDEDTAFDLMSGTDPNYRSSDAGSLLVWEAIVRAATTSKSLNFSGGSLAGVEPFLASFGARQQPYLTISRTSLRWQTLELGRRHLRAGRTQLDRIAKR